MRRPPLRREGIHDGVFGPWAVVSERTGNAWMATAFAIAPSGEHWMYALIFDAPSRREAVKAVVQEADTCVYRQQAMSRPNPRRRHEKLRRCGQAR